MLKTKISYTLEETKELANEFAKVIKTGDLIFLKGNLGAGKTTFMKALSTCLNGIDENEVQSPTYTYINSYPGTPTIHHFDLYRLNSFEQFKSMGLDEFLFSEAICCIEWAERLPELNSMANWIVEFKHLDDTHRNIKISHAN